MTRWAYLVAVIRPDDTGNPTLAPELYARVGVFSEDMPTIDGRGITACLMKADGWDYEAAVRNLKRYCGQSMPWLVEHVRWG